MKTMLIAAAAIVTVSAGAASADDSYNCTVVAQDKRMTVAAIEEKAKGMGYDVLRVGMERGCFQVKAVDANGNDFDVYFDPETAKLLGTND